MSTGDTTRSARYRAKHRKTNRRPLIIAVAAVATALLALAWPGTSGAALQVDTSDPRAVAVAMRTGCQAWLAAHPSGSSAQRTRMTQCVTDETAIIAALDAVTPTPTGTTGSPTSSPTPSTPTGTPSSSPTPSPTVVPTTPSPTPTATTPSPTPTPTPTPTITGPVAGCPAYPAMPDGACTGWQHTGVTLHPCTLPLTQPAYDSCDFPAGEVNVSAANIHVSRSRFRGAIVYRQADDGSLRGLVLTDVEIDSSATLGTSSIGNNDWTCVRCNVHGGTRGANPGHNAVLRDSWLHDWTSRTGDHITGVGSNGGSDNVIDHNNIACSITNDRTGFACSSGLSVYGDDAPGNSRWTITNNLINSGSSYCVIIAGPPAKPYPFDHMVFAGNVFGADGALARNLDLDRCTEFGPVATQPGSWGSQAAPVNGNAWYGNVTLAGTPVVPQ